MPVSYNALKISIYFISATSTCNHGMVHCLQSDECIHHYMWCDEEYDCVDGTDEEFCDGSE